MKKLRVFFVAAAMLLVTAGVFAGKAKFSTAASNIYYYDGVSHYELIGTGTAAGTTLVYGASGTVVSVTGTNSNQYFLYTNTSSGYQPVYSTF